MQIMVLIVNPDLWALCCSTLCGHVVHCFVESGWQDLGHKISLNLSCELSILLVLDSISLLEDFSISFLDVSISLNIFFNLNLICNYLHFHAIQQTIMSKLPFKDLKTYKKALLVQSMISTKISFNRIFSAFF